MRICGIDPGLSGAIVTIEYDATGLPVDVSVMDIPTIGEKTQRQVDGGLLHAMLCDIACGRCDHVFMELLHAMPPPQKGRAGRGTVAGWKLAVCVGHLEQAIIQLELPHTFVTPQQWKKAARIGGGGPEAKEKARARALQLFPMARSKLYRVKDADRAEALLIADWGHKHLTGIA